MIDIIELTGGAKAVPPSRHQDQ